MIIKKQANTIIFAKLYHLNKKTINKIIVILEKK